MRASIRTAVLLVAGTGSRLRPITDNIPKALVPLGAETIMHRIVRQLRQCGIARFVFATGYCEQAVRAAMQSVDVESIFCRNDDYASTQNSISLVKCAEVLAGESFVKLDGDLVVSDGILERILCDSSAMTVAVDTSRQLDEESMKAAIDDDGQIRNFGKSLPLSQARAESIGIEKLDANSGEAVLSRIVEHLQRGTTNKYYEDVYAELIREERLHARAVDVAGLGWSEVDTLEDLQAARCLVGG